jgi:hypothetical protein
MLGPASSRRRLCKTRESARRAVQVCCDVVMLCPIRSLFTPPSPPSSNRLHSFPRCTLHAACCPLRDPRHCLFETTLATRKLQQAASQA